jgi:phasin family protein
LDDGFDAVAVDAVQAGRERSGRQGVIIAETGASGSGRPFGSGLTAAGRTASLIVHDLSSANLKRGHPMTDDSKSNEGGKTGEMPLFDFTKMLSQFRIPGVDFAAIVDRERKNIEALAAANKIAFEGWQALIRRQSEILQEAMRQAVTDASQEDALKKRADLAKERFEGALNNMRELAEMATKSQKDAFDVVRKRVEENMEGFRNFGKKSD